MIPYGNVEQGARLLKQGGLVAFPTETVYGLGANALDTKAIARVFAVKNRPAFDPLIVHIPDPSWMDRLCHDIPLPARRLAERFWPGPLSLALPKRDIVPDMVTSGLASVALRIPRHPLALELLRAAGLPVAAPSANPFGGISPTLARHVAEGFAAGIDLIIDGGPCDVGIESSVIRFDADGVAVVLRPGGLSVDDIAEAIGCRPRIQAHIWNDDAETGRLAPGMLLRHYAPSTPVVLFPHNSVPTPPNPARTGLLLASRRAPAADIARQCLAFETLSERGDTREMAKHLFEALRRLDAAGAACIFAERSSDDGLGIAINDRLERAAAGHSLRM